jgi:hypothetical protein
MTQHFAAIERIEPEFGGETHDDEYSSENDGHQRSSAHFAHGPTEMC